MGNQLGAPHQPNMMPPQGGRASLFQDFSGPQYRQWSPQLLAAALGQHMRQGYAQMQGPGLQASPGMMPAQKTLGPGGINLQAAPRPGALPGSGRFADMVRQIVHSGGGGAPGLDSNFRDTPWGGAR